MASTLSLGHIDRRLDLKDCGIVLGASVIISLFGPIAIPLPFSPVPIATQAHVILLLSVFLGSKRAALAVLAFLAQGAMGLPVFACAKGGVHHFFGPTGGYLIGYLAAAFVTGYLCERIFKRTLTNVFLAMGIGNLVIYAFGLPVLSLFCGWSKAFQFGMLPFLVGDFLKLICAGKIFKKIAMR